MTTESLNIIGAGKVASVLARQWFEAGIVDVLQVCNRSLESSRSACHFIGAGHAVAAISAMSPATYWLLGCDDTNVPQVATALAQSGIVAKNAVAFHLSGALTHEVLAPLATVGVMTASLHPLCSVPDVERAYRNGPPQCYALQGDSVACERLMAFCFGTRVIRLRAEQKVLYHAANTMLCNHLVALLDAGLACFAKAGIGQDLALTMVAPLMNDTLQYALAMGPTRALTGPVARGDAATVAAHIDAIPVSLRPMYRLLTHRALSLATRQGKLSVAQIEQLSAILTCDTTTANAPECKKR